jgi:hypothetical protein
MPINFRPLGIIKEIINETGLDITYAYDDLVFAEHSLLIVKFCDDTPSSIEVYFNKDCEDSARSEFMEKIIEESGRRNFTAIEKGEFTLKDAAEEENLEITFYERSVYKG